MRSRLSGEHQKGVAAVEFAIVLVFLILVVAGIVEFGRAFWYYDALSKATRDGARRLSLADKATFSTGSFITDAQNHVVARANAANLNPPLAPDNVLVTCLGLSPSFAEIGCGSGTNAPQNIRVAITGYTINIGAMIPFLSATGGGSTVFNGVALAPYTTMPYMK